MDIRTIALTLLLGRIVSIVFISLVIKRQLDLFKTYIEPELVGFRKVLFLLTVAIFIGNLIPIIIDTGTLLADVSRPQPTLLELGYVYSNNLAAVTSGGLIWLIYRLAAKTTLGSPAIKVGSKEQQDAV